jgi:hypothetical protein
MARKLEVIIRNRIDIPAIAKAIRAEGYRTKTEGKGKKIVALESSFLSKFHSPDRFQKLEDGWVKDNLLNLDWSPSSDKRMSWTEAKEYATEQGGRLPEVDELASLVDRSKRSPAIDTKFFSDTKIDDYYWTNTKVAGSSGYAWFVFFYRGGVFYYGKGSSLYVRAVRSSQ